MAHITRLLSQSICPPGKVRGLELGIDNSRTVDISSSIKLVSSSVAQKTKLIPRYVDTELEMSRTVKQGLSLFRGDK